jgi:hypothetical protein
MTKSKRLVSLLIIMSFGLLIAYLMGQNDEIPWKKTLGCPLYSVFKQGLINFQFLVAHSVTEAIQTVLNLLDRAQNVIF